MSLLHGNRIAGLKNNKLDDAEMGLHFTSLAVLQKPVVGLKMRSQNDVLLTDIVYPTYQSLMTDTQEVSGTSVFCSELRRSFENIF
jgi:hypothetical protein